jgi:hypothetical protein
MRAPASIDVLYYVDRPLFVDDGPDLRRPLGPIPARLWFVTERAALAEFRRWQRRIRPIARAASVRRPRVDLGSITVRVTAAPLDERAAIAWRTKPPTKILRIYRPRWLGPPEMLRYLNRVDIEEAELEDEEEELV